MRRWWLVAVLFTPVPGVVADDPAWIARAKGGLVAADSPEASQLGADVLTQGGSAFDAAVAVSLALTVARPESTGLGGGGFLIAYVADKKQFVALDFRETAPAGASAERYAKLHAARGDGPSPSLYGGNAVAVPGLLAGLVMINDRWGRWQWGDAVRPVIKLCQNGFTADESFRGACEEAIGDFKKWPDFAARFPQLYALVQTNGAAPALGSRVRRDELAKALLLIQRQGAAALYDGLIGAAIVETVQAAGGVMTLEDLKGYRVKEREPLRFRFGEYEFVTMPPPSSGGVCLAEALNIYAATRARSELQDGSLRSHVLIEAMKHAFADRTLMGDVPAGELPLKRLLAPSYAAVLAGEIKVDRVGPLQQYGVAGVPGDFPDDGGTLHFCIADRHGNIVAMTETINGTFGSYLVAGESGIILNNQMDDFTTAPGQANLFGLVQGEENLVAPGKRPLSSMTPTIVLKDGKPFLVLGGSGGPRIISNVLQVALNVIDGKPLQEAIESPRFHHQWQPDEVFFDRAPPAALVDDLKKRGHTVSERRRGAAVQAIQFLDDGVKVGASDPKKGGRPWGAP